MTYTPLTPEQFQSAQSAGFSTDQIIENEKIRKSQMGQEKKPGLLKSIGSALISSEKGLATSFASAFGADPSKANVDTALESQRLTDQAKGLTGDRRKQLLGQSSQLATQAQGGTQARIEELPTNKQVLGQAGGVALDIVGGGAIAKGAQGFKLLKAAETVATGTKAVKATTYGGRVVDILKKTGINALKGAPIGYGYDVTSNLQQNKGIGESLKPGLGTAFGAGIPVAFGGLNVARETFKTVGKETAPKLINSLIKPLGKDFSYGKNPGRAVSDEGIVANSWDELISKIHDRRNSVGSQLEKVANQLDTPPILPRLGQRGLRKALSLEDMLNPINVAIKEAEKTPRTNSSLLQRLQDVKRDILGVTLKDGQEVATRDLKNLSFNEALEIKRLIGDLTKWTGNVSDDKAVNGVLKRVYGVAKETLTGQAEKQGKGAEWRKLSEKYADLTSAEVAAKYKDVLLQRQDLVSLKGHLGAATAVITTIMSGGTALPVVLAGVGGAALDKALGSVVVKTRIAAWLAKESPSVLEKFFANNPNVAKSIYKAFHGENKSLDDLVKGAVSEAKKNPEGGFVRLGGRTVKEIDEPTKNEMWEAIKYLNDKKADYNNKIEINIEKLAEKFGITTDNPSAIRKRLMAIIENTKTKDVSSRKPLFKTEKLK